MAFAVFLSGQLAKVKTFHMLGCRKRGEFGFFAADKPFSLCTVYFHLVHNFTVALCNMINLHVVVHIAPCTKVQDGRY